MKAVARPLITRRETLALGLSSLAGSALIWAGPARSDGLSAPAGVPVLTVSGAVAITNADGAALFDLAMLDALDQRETVTATPWHDGVRHFSGPTLAAILAAVGATGQTLRIVALNDYAADMPLSDATNLPVILASRIDGAEIAVRDKGPLFVIYPFDEMPELFNEVTFGRSVWQVKSIEVLA